MRQPKFASKYLSNSPLDPSNFSQFESAFLRAVHDYNHGKLSLSYLVKFCEYLVSKAPVEKLYTNKIGELILNTADLSFYLETDPQSSYVGGVIDDLRNLTQSSKIT